MNWHVPPIEAAGIFPVPEQILSYYEQLEKLTATLNADAAPDSSKANHTTVTLFDEPTTPHSSPVVASTTASFPSTSTESVDSTTSRSVALSIPLSKALNRYLELSKVDSRYFVCKFDEIVLVSNWLHTVQMPLEDR